MKKKYILTLSFIIPALQSFSQNCNLFSNGNFESPVFSSTPAYFTSAVMGGWQTTSPDGKMELWNSGYIGILSYSGVQHMEIDGYYDSAVYQNIVVSPWTNLEISFAHRGRAGIDTMSVSAGPVGGPYTTIGVFADSPSAWGYYSVNYLVPNLGNNYSIRFNPLYGAGVQGLGNFLDSVTVCATNVGINEFNLESSVSVFPSLFTDNIKIVSEVNEGMKISFYDVTLQKIAEKTFIKELSIEAGRFSKGIYFYLIENKNGVIKKGKAVKE